MSSIKKNFSYNIIYQVLIIILPLITAPYISRTIGAEGSGIYSYTYSIANYFALFAMLGLNNYGNRSIAKCKDDKEKLSREFSSIYSLQIITSVLVILVYVIYISLFDNKYFTNALIQLIYLVSTCFDINWLFFGLEKFKLTVTRNTIIKILSAISIFIFVKDKNDLIVYTIIMAGTTLITQLSLWPFLRKEIKFIKPRFKDIVKHIKPNLILFIPVIAVSIYKVMDKIMLGNMSTMEDVGYYEYADRITNIPLTFITALGTVMLPRVSNLVSKGEKSKIKFYFDKSMQFVLFLSIAICFGLIVVAPEFVPIYLGEEFAQSGTIVQCLSFTIIFAACANVIRTQYLIPNEKDKSYIVSVSVGAIVNFVINMILIPKYQAVGAAIGTVFAEFSVMLVQIIAVIKEIDLKKYLKYFIRFIVSGLVMYILLISLDNLIFNKYILIAVQVLLGILVYFTLNYKFILENIQYIPVLNKLKK